MPTKKQKPAPLSKLRTIELDVTSSLTNSTPIINFGRDYATAFAAFEHVVLECPELQKVGFPPEECRVETSMVPRGFYVHDRSLIRTIRENLKYGKDDVLLLVETAPGKFTLSFRKRSAAVTQRLKDSLSQEDLNSDLTPEQLRRIKEVLRKTKSTKS